MNFPKEKNDFIIKPIKGLKKPDKKWKYYDIFKREFFNIALLSRTGAGKTTVIYNLIEKFATKRTICMLFSSTINNDESWKSITDLLQQRNIEYIAETHFKTAEGNYIEEWMDEIQNPEIEIDEPNQFIKTDRVEKKNDKPKDLTEWIIVFDDLSKDMRDSCISKLLKKSRHFRAKVIISSQSLTDIDPDSHGQLYALLLFSGLSQRSIDYIQKTYELWVDKEKFYQIYKEITDQPFTFLTLLPYEREIRKNLNIVIDEFTRGNKVNLLLPQDGKKVSI